MEMRLPTLLSAPRAWVALMWLPAIIAFAGPAGAASELDGRIVGIQPHDTVLIEHAAFAGMPAMTMPFRLPRGTTVKLGETVMATVDQSTEPASLTHLRIRHVPLRQDAPRVQSLRIGDAVPDVAFIDQRSRRFSFSSLHGHRYAMSFIYTRCPDPRMCPLISSKFREAQAAVGPGVRLIEVTLDPVFDTPAVLARYGRAFGADPRHWLLITGDPSRTQALDRAVGIDVAHDAHGMLHTERLVIVDGTGHIEQFVDNPEWTASDLTSILDARESVWERFVLTSNRTLAWCGEHLGSRGRTAVHHVAVILLPIAFLTAVVLLAQVASFHSSRGAVRRR